MLIKPPNYEYLSIYLKLYKHIELDIKFDYIF